MGGDGLVPLLVAAVLGDPAQVVAAQHDGAVHLGAANHALEDAAADADVAGEGALLVDVRALQRGGLRVVRERLAISVLC